MWPESAVHYSTKTGLPLLALVLRQQRKEAMMILLMMMMRRTETVEQIEMRSIQSCLERVLGNILAMQDKWNWKYKDILTVTELDTLRRLFIPS